MSRVIRGPESRCAIEVLRTDSEAVLAMLDSDCQITLRSHPLTWAEIGEQFREGKRFFEFDQVWRPLDRLGPTGIEPYPVIEAVRKFIRGCFSAPAGFKGGSLDALADLLPHGDVHVFTREWGFIGRFASVEDAQMISGALQAVKPIIFSTAEEFMGLVDLDQSVVLTDLDPAREWPTNITRAIATGVLEMAKKKVKVKAKKVKAAEATQRRTDGPVHKARAMFEKMRESDSSEIIAACVAAGINKGTATTQLGRWRKENGIAVKRGGARSKTDKKAATDAPAKKKGGKKKEKKTEDKKEQGIPPGPKGSKRHKPQPPQPSEPSSSTASPSSTSSSPSQGNQVANGPKASTATASPASPGAATAADSKAATSPGTASGGATTADPSKK